MLNLKETQEEDVKKSFNELSAEFADLYNVKSKKRNKRQVLDGLMANRLVKKDRHIEINGSSVSRRVKIRSKLTPLYFQLFTRRSR